MLILAELEGLHPMRLQLFGFPDPLYGHLGDSQVFCQTARGPMRPALWLHLHSGMDDALPHLGGYHPLAAALATSIAQPLGGAFGNRLLCSSWLEHRGLRFPRRPALLWLRQPSPGLPVRPRAAATGPRSCDQCPASG